MVKASPSRQFSEWLDYQDNREFFRILLASGRPMPPHHFLFGIILWPYFYRTHLKLKCMLNWRHCPSLRWVPIYIVHCGTSGFVVMVLLNCRRWGQASNTGQDKLLKTKVGCRVPDMKVDNLCQYKVTVEDAIWHYSTLKSGFESALLQADKHHPQYILV